MLIKFRLFIRFHRRFEVARVAQTRIPNISTWEIYIPYISMNQAGLLAVKFKPQPIKKSRIEWTCMNFIDRKPHKE